MAFARFARESTNLPRIPPKTIDPPKNDRSTENSIDRFWDKSLANRVNAIDPYGIFRHRNNLFESIVASLR